MDYPQEVSWLGKRFREVPSDSPVPMRVRFKSIHELLAAQFPTTKFSPKVVSDIVNSAFPNSTRVTVGKGIASHVVGIEEVGEEEQQCDDLDHQKALNAKLIERTQQLEVHIQS